MAGMVKAGLGPASEADRKCYARRVAMDYMRRFHRMVRASSPRATVFFNGRGIHSMRQELAFQTQIEIESLPTGSWGYGYFPPNVRYVRTFGRPYMGMTARFHKSWADFGGLKPYPALEYETSLMMAHGARCSIGDQMHPRGVLDQAAYDIIGQAYARVADREPWLVGARTLAEIGVVRAAGLQPDAKLAAAVDDGACRMLTHVKYQFDMVDFESDLDRYPVLVLPDVIRLDVRRLKRLREYLRQGGRLLASGQSGLSEDGRTCLVPELGAKPAGPSPFTVTYFRVRRHFAAGMPETDHVIYDRGWRVLRSGRGSPKVLANIVEPYFERVWDHFCSHQQTPGDRLTKWTAAVVGPRAGYVSFPIFGAYARHGNFSYRLLVRKLLAELLPDPLLTVESPVTAEATVVRQGPRHIVHLLYYTPQRWAEGMDLITDITPLYDVRVSLRLPKAPRRVYLAPEQREIPFACIGGRVNVVVPQVAGHAMVVFTGGIE